MSETKKDRTSVFGRSYDHQKAECRLEVAGHPDATTTVALEGVPQSVVNSFALLGLTSFVVSAGHKAKKAGKELADVIAATRAAIEQAKAGKVEFASGYGLGGTSTNATVLVGRALVELGKKFVAWNGQRYTFEGDAAKAGAAMKALYEDTTEVEVKGKKVTGRQFYNQIAAIPEVAEKVKAYRDEDAVSVEEDMLG